MNRFLYIAIVVSAAVVVQGKTRRIDASDQVTLINPSSSTIASLERRLSPFFEHRIAHRLKNDIAATVASPRDIDLMLLGKSWKLLSPQFKKLYLAAMQLPDSSEQYDTPGGHFAIFYTTSGPDAVDTADEYGFSVANWRFRTGQPNGIPDYIDETAFALDSSWVMEIDRFGFPPPPRGAASASGRYTVSVEALPGEGDYGYTYPLDKPEDMHGFPSTLLLRNSWGAAWADLGYDRNPISGVRVTCAHEFFHAIQYGMTWGIFQAVELDDFPWSWTEGAAVSMEELAFDSVNDYLQYAPGYFGNPGMSFFNPATEDDKLYTNGILVLYLARYFPPGNGCEFVKSMLRTNYAEPTPFNENLRATAAQKNRSWAGLLHDFHVASFFTGNHADTTRFLPDASRFLMHTPSAQPETDSIISDIALNSAKLIRLQPADFKRDTLSIFFSGDAPSHIGEISGSGWACSILLRKTATADTFITLPIDASCRGALALPSWPAFSEAVIIITNGDPLENRTATIHFSETVVKSPVRTIVFPNPVSVNRRHQPVHFRGNGITNVSVRSVNGTLVWRTTANARTADEITWDCRTGSGLPVSPGTYMIVCTRDNGATGSVEHERFRLLVIP